MKINNDIRDLFYQLEQTHKKATETHRGLIFELAREGKRLTEEDENAMRSIEIDTEEHAITLGQLAVRLNPTDDPDDDIEMEDVNEPARIRKRGAFGRWWAKVMGAGRE